jgi:hypothetical protein
LVTFVMEKDKRLVVLNGNFYRREKNGKFNFNYSFISSSMVYCGQYITMAVAAIGGFGLTFAFGLDLIYACGLVENLTLAGQILTGLVLMSGSSAVAEVIERVKGGNQIITDTRDSNLDE